MITKSVEIKLTKDIVIDETTRIGMAVEDGTFYIFEEGLETCVPLEDYLATFKNE
ncbi:MAG: hypothetical protein WCR24_05190 [Candidatus Methanomethylophilaceae archaeon]